MNTKINRIFLIFLIGILAGCSSMKDVTYLRDMDELATMNGQPATVSDYKLKTNDNLYISIQSANQEVSALFNSASSQESGSQQLYGEPSGQYLFGYMIENDGSITLPVVGKIEVAGLTQVEAQSRIQLKTNEFLKGALVKVKMLNFKITLLGEFKSPGVYYNYNNSLTVMEAIGMAGGLTDYAKINRLLVVRKTAEGTKSFRLDLSNKNIFANQAYYLQPNDMVYAEPAKSKALQLNIPTISLAISSLSLLLVILTLKL